MQKLHILTISCLLIILSGCSIYKMNIRQGNIIEQKHVSQLRQGMSKGQVQYLLGRPVVQDTFSDDTWYYINTFKDGKTEKETRTELVLTFVDEKLHSVKGDYEIPEDFAATEQP